MNRFQRYGVEPSSLMAVTSQDLNLRIQYWWVNHKLELRRRWVFSLLLLDALLLVVVVAYVFLTVRGSVQLSRQVTEGAATLAQPVQVTNRPADVSIQNQWGVRNANGSTDFIALVTNSNTEWYAGEVIIRFTVNGSPLDETLSTFLMPGQTRHVFFNRTGALAPSSRVDAEVVSTTWERPSSLFDSENTSFSVANATFSALTIISGQQTDASRVTAEVTNNSIYGFWAVPVTIIVFRGGEPVAVDEQVLRQVQPFETQTVTAQWLQRIPSGGEIVVEPYVNAFDEENRLPVG